MRDKKLLHEKKKRKKIRKQMEIKIAETETNKKQFFSFLNLTKGTRTY